MNNYNKYCIVCGSYSNGKPQCYNCWVEAVNYEAELENNSKYSKYWNSLKNLFTKTLNKINKTTNEFEKFALCNHLIGIGFFENDNYEDANDELLNNAYDTIINISKQNLNSTIKPTYTLTPYYDSETQDTNNTPTDYRKQFPADILCQDGHYVRSKEERAIDDYLYQTAKLLHAYEPKFRLTPEEQKICKKAGKEFDYFYPDFYIPEYNLYIEFFGKNEEKYNLKTDLKIKIYKSRKNINFAYLTYNDSNILLEKLEDILDNFRNGNNNSNENDEPDIPF